MPKAFHLKLSELENVFGSLEGYTDIQFFEPKFSNKDYHALDFHSDFISFLDNTGTDKNKFQEYVKTIGENYTDEVLVAEVMDEEGYNTTINANYSMGDDFEEEYGNKNAEVLCILLKKEEPQ